MGNPAFSLPVLQAVHSCWGDPVGVYTAPDRRRGRGLRKGYSEIKTYSIEKGWPVFQPSSLNCPQSTKHFRDLAPEIVVVAAYGLLIPSEMLDVPRHGFLNIHPSLLPRYRGPSPVPGAILDGADETGVSLMLLDRGWDTGPVLAQESTKILPDERADALTRRLFQMGAQLLTEHAPRWTARRISPQPQDPTLVTHTAKLTREDGQANWRESSAILCRRFRAYTPWPGLYTHWRGKRLRLLDVSEFSPSVANETSGQMGTSASSQDKKTPGMVKVLPGLPDVLAIQAGERTHLLVRQLQLEGRRPQSAAEFLRGYPDIVGERLDG